MPLPYPDDNLSKLTSAQIVAKMHEAYRHHREAEFLMAMKLGALLHGERFKYRSDNEFEDALVKIAPSVCATPDALQAWWKLYVQFGDQPVATLMKIGLQTCFQLQDRSPKTRAKVIAYAASSNRLSPMDEHDLSIVLTS